MVTSNDCKTFSRVLLAAALFATSAACGPKPAAQAVVPYTEPNAEAILLLERAAAAFGKQHPHGLEPRLVWARGRGFDVIRNQWTGTILSRGVGMGMYVFDPSNQQCWLWVCDMFQQDTGGQWGEPFIPLDSCVAPAQVTCESLDSVIAQTKDSSVPATPSPS